MKLRIQIPIAIASIIACASITTAQDSAPAAPENKIALTRIYENIAFKKPVQIARPGAGDNRRFLVLQEGRILRLPADPAASEAKVMLDITNRKLSENDFEEGLLGLAFHPRFKENRKFYIYHSQQNPKRSVIAEMQMSKDDPDKADPASERVLFEVRQPFWNHNSGNMVFGPDGMLYIALGDGGKANDVRELAQNLFVLNGKILRIDVDTKTGDLEYGIPADNPFVKSEGILPEIWCFGMRNPWGLAFDGSGNLWCADVGQNKWEEINLIVKGGNYGWSYREGLEEFNLVKRPIPKEARFIDPIHQYPRTDGISITGGFRYEKGRVAMLRNHYLFADWGLGTIWGLHVEDGKVVKNQTLYKRPTQGATARLQPTAFYETEDGEALVLSWNGMIFRIEAR
jgi:glucose/arabinose dehydrogenase